MPQVPRIEPGQVQQQGLPNVRVSTDAPIEAFGGGQGVAKTFEAGNQLISTGQAIFQEEKKKADQIAAMDYDRNLSELETRIQLDVKKMQGKNAAGAFDYAKDSWEKESQKLKEGLSNDDQRMFAQRASSARWESLNRSVQMHSAQQMEKYDDETTAGYVTQAKAAAVTNAFDDERIDLELSRQKAALQDLGKRKGVLENPEFQQKVNAIISDTHKGVINARLVGGDPKSARQYFETNKDAFGADVTAVEKDIQDGEVLTLGQETWGELMGKRLSNGEPDLKSIRANIMGRKDWTPTTKEKVVSYVEARAAEDVKNTSAANGALLSKFENIALAAHDNKQSMSEILRLVGSYTQKVNGKPDLVDREAKEKFVRSLFATKIVSDVKTEYSLWSGIQQGTTTAVQIDEAQNKGLLNGTDWMGLRKELDNSKVNGTSQDFKQSWQRVENLANKTFPNSAQKNDKDAFLLEVRNSAKGKSGDEMFVIAQDKLKEDKNHAGWFSGPKQFKSDVAQRDAGSTAMGTLYRDLGQDVVSAIGSGKLLQGAKTWGSNDVSLFANELGGYQNIQKGTPAHNAMMYLMSIGEPVDPRNVKEILRVYPDGLVGKGNKARFEKVLKEEGLE